VNAILRKKLRAVAAFSAFTALLGAGIGFFVVALGEPLPWPPVLGVIIGTTLGIAIGVSEEFVIPRLSGRFGFHALNAIRLAIYAVAIAIWIVLANAVLDSAILGITVGEGALNYLRDDILARDMLLAVFAAVIAIFGLQLLKLHRPREILQLLAGKYYYPEEEERIVLFADLADSSAIVERLSPVMASRFLRDCFADISEPILAWSGEVYQHLGDGIIVTWPNMRPRSAERSIQCFFEIRRLLLAREALYRDRYDAVPRFRGGLHAGRVTATWVGEARRELALHGDVLHVASRLQALCKTKGVDCLVSREWLDCLVLPKVFEAVDLGEVELRGRSTAVRVFSVSE